MPMKEATEKEEGTKMKENCSSKDKRVVGLKLEHKRDKITQNPWEIFW